MDYILPKMTKDKIESSELPKRIYVLLIQFTHFIVFKKVFNEILNVDQITSLHEVVLSDPE